MTVLALLAASCMCNQLSDSQRAVQSAQAAQLGGAAGSSDDFTSAPLTTKPNMEIRIDDSGVGLSNTIEKVRRRHITPSADCCLLGRGCQPECTR